MVNKSNNRKVINRKVNEAWIHWNVNPIVRSLEEKAAVTLIYFLWRKAGSKKKTGPLISSDQSQLDFAIYVIDFFQQNGSVNPWILFFPLDPYKMYL